MKGIIIYGNPMWGDNERAIYCEFINEASFELKMFMVLKSLQAVLKEKLQNALRQYAHQKTHMTSRLALLLL